MALLRSAVRSRYTPNVSQEICRMLTNFYHSAVNLYWAQELPGEELVQPLKNFRGYMVHELSSSDMKVIRLAHVLSIVAYSILGLIAAVGMCIKLSGIAGVKAHNEEEKQSLEMFQKNAIGEDMSGFTVKAKEGWAMTEVKKHCFEPVQVEYTPENREETEQVKTSKKKEKLAELVTKEKLEPFIHNLEGEIDAFTNRYEKVYVQYHGNWMSGVTICLSLFQSTSPYCGRGEAMVQINHLLQPATN